MNQLRPYQNIGIDNLAYKASLGLRRLICQLATGGGKTVMFAGLCNRYLKTNDKNILILVHREELLKQARRTIYDWYGLIAEPITAASKVLPPARIYVAMVETAYNRLKKYPSYFHNVGLLIIDECHIGNFNKLIPMFDESLLIGYTATPVSSSKKHPLKNIYEDIVCCIDIPELIQENALVSNRTYRAKNIHRNDLKVKAGEFDEKQMGAEFSKAKHIHNTVIGYERHGLGTKTLVFNCNVEHSLKVAEAFTEKGYKCRHLDGTMPSHVREEILLWFKETEDAILCNIGILTTGFDEPSVKTIIVNRSTKSVPLWLQMCGRGSRKFPGKEHFTIIDMGDNIMELGDWCDRRDWQDIFHNPDKPSEGGVAPIKECESCEAIIAATTKICKYCGALQPVKEPTYDDKVVEFELVTKQIDVKRLTDANANRKPYYTLHQLKTEMVAKAKADLGLAKITDEIAYRLLSLYQEKVAEWCKITGKKYNQWHKDTTAQWFLAELKTVFGWEPTALSIAI